MDKLVPGYLKSYGVPEEKEHEVSYGNYHRIQQLSEQLVVLAKLANIHAGLEEMDRVLQIGDMLKKELDYVRTDLSRRKNLELLLPSPNTQHHLPCSSLVSPASTPPSPSAQQSMAMNTTHMSSSPNAIVPQSPNGSNSPHALIDNSSMSIASTGIMQSDEYWRSRKMDPTKIVRRSPTPLYVNLTEQMILAQSSKRKRPAEGDLYCHNCKTKDTPEWRRGPMGAKTLCNACGIRWRLSQAEAAKQKKGDPQLSPTQMPQLQFPLHVQLPSPSGSPQSPSTSPTQAPTQISVHNLLQQQAQLQRQQLQHLQQQQQLQQLQQQYVQSHALHQPPHPQQQHMIVPGPVGMAQENIPIPNPNLMPNGTNTNGRLVSLPGDGTANGRVMSSLSMAPIAT